MKHPLLLLCHCSGCNPPGHKSPWSGLMYGCHVIRTWSISWYRKLTFNYLSCGLQHTNAIWSQEIFKAVLQLGRTHTDHNNELLAIYYHWMMNMSDSNTEASFFCQKYKNASQLVIQSSYWLKWLSINHLLSFCFSRHILPLQKYESSKQFKCSSPCFSLLHDVCSFITNSEALQGNSSLRRGI